MRKGGRMGKARKGRMQRARRGVTARVVQFVYCSTQRPATSFCVICTGLSSMPTPGPNRGTTKMVRVSDAPDAVVAALAASACAAVSTGLLKVHIGRPRTGSHAGLTLVMAAERERRVSLTLRSG